MASSVAQRERSSFIDKEKATQAGGTMLKMTIGAIMGGMAGAAMPGPSFVMGLASTFMGAYMQSPMMAAMGTGMIAAGSGTMAAQASGKEMKQAPDGKKFDIKTEMDNAKSRAMGYKESFMEKFPFNMLKKKEAESDESNLDGLGNLDAASLAALDRIENSMIDSAVQFQATRPELAMETEPPGLYDSSGLYIDAPDLMTAGVGNVDEF